MNKTILITGASSGIGRATALLFQEKGWNVIATMRTPEKESELKSLDNVLVNKLDVLEIDTIKSSLKEGIEKFGKIDVVLNNAGYALMGTFESAKRESIIRQFGVNVQGLFDVTQEVLPHFRANKEGMFINISSIGGKMTFPLMPLYHSTKWAVEGFSESLRWEMAQIGVKVKLVEPGGVATDFGGRSLDMQHNPELTEYNEFVGAFTKAMQASMDPSNMSKAEQIAEVIYTAATDGKDTLRYRAGADAKQLLAARSNMSDEEFFTMQEQQFGL
ncbi:SDR family oxidoreductase [Marivirga arenosa]|uniref:SDR family oxidoreductase n=1 Tax=Marivirga arenosa TaxID=3059076 RepID=A0AA51N7P2_9BACT|nr:SDR family oxidoreductase [Marivirga sp. ABR2-2]WMN06046.1 SDR family oxidoreductase [Marivirga sp. ABR2-2]